MASLSTTQVLSRAQGELAARIPLDHGWELASTNLALTPDSLTSLQFTPVDAPCTVAAALRGQRRWKFGGETRFDESEHWFRCRFDAAAVDSDEQLVLHFDGLATISQVWLNAELILESDSMFMRHDIDVTSLICDRNELLVVFRSLNAALRPRRGQQPVARWRTRVVPQQQLRWFRTTLLGRAPGFAPEPEPVGLWRPVTLLRHRRLALEEWSRQALMSDTDGCVETQIRFRKLSPGPELLQGRLFIGDVCAPVNWQNTGEHLTGRASIRIPNVQLWWPHTHGAQPLYPVRVQLLWKDGGSTEWHGVPIGFRSLESAPQPTGDAGLSLRLNGVPVFCRGVVWTPRDIVTLASRPEDIRERLQLLKDCGLNLIRIAGTTYYETDSFHQLCDELGFLVWQDMMFANMDYPFSDPGFHRKAIEEAKEELSRLGCHPSTAVICGNSEVEQQVAMLGLDPEMGRGSFFGEDLPRLVAEHCPCTPYVPSAPCGGDLPFRTRIGVANYFGVGAYLRPLEDARRAEVRFASECLAFSNVPEPERLTEMASALSGPLSLNNPAWKSGVPRDIGANWDFEDVRDHYLRLLYSVDPMPLRYADPDRYLELSRIVTGEAMASVFNEWRRPASTCNGAIILWCADIRPGAGWGILDDDGQPKAAYWFLKRALAPCAVWTTDEGLNGIDIHIANELAEPFPALLQIATYRHGEQLLNEVNHALTLPPHSVQTLNVEQVFGRFIDASYAYRFGPPAHDVLVASLSPAGRDEPLSEAFYFPVTKPIQQRALTDLGLTAEARVVTDNSIELLLNSRRVAWGVQVRCPNWLPADNYFGLQPGGRRRILLHPKYAGAPAPGSLTISAANGDGRLNVSISR